MGIQTPGGSVPASLLDSVFCAFCAVLWPFSSSISTPAGFILFPPPFRVELHKQPCLREVTMRRFLLAVLLLGWPAPVAFAQPAADPAPAVDAGASVYQKVVRSTVWIHSTHGRQAVTGSGTLVDKGRRLVLTNYHVVGNVKKATVYFPVFNGKKPVSTRKYYLDRAGRLGIPGEVVELDKQADLALIRVNRVPEGVPALPLAPESPDPGQTVHSIGNPGKSGRCGSTRPARCGKFTARSGRRSSTSARRPRSRRR